MGRGTSPRIAVLRKGHDLSGQYKLWIRLHLPELKTQLSYVSEWSLVVRPVFATFLHFYYFDGRYYFG